MTHYSLLWLGDWRFNNAGAVRQTMTIQQFLFLAQQEEVTTGKRELILVFDGGEELLTWCFTLTGAKQMDRWQTTTQPSQPVSEVE